MWQPSAHPDPHEIFNGARADIEDGLHERALAKLVWFHHNAEKYFQGLGGVRLSYALCDWLSLAKVYPPAMTAYVQTRDDAEAAIRRLLESPQSSVSRKQLFDDCFQHFHDLSALNGYLGEGRRTAELFLAIAEHDQEIGKLTYHVAEPFLVDAGWYDKCGPFLEPDQRVKFAAYVRGMGKQMELTNFLTHPGIPATADKRFMSEIGTLISLLVRNNRLDEATKVRDEALRTINSTGFRLILSAAFAGQPPKQRT